MKRENLKLPSGLRAILVANQDHRMDPSKPRNHPFKPAPIQASSMSRWSRVHRREIGNTRIAILVDISRVVPTVKSPHRPRNIIMGSASGRKDIRHKVNRLLEYYNIVHLEIFMNLFLFLPHKGSFSYSIFKKCKFSRHNLKMQLNFEKSVLRGTRIFKIINHFKNIKMSCNYEKLTIHVWNKNWASGSKNAPSARKRAKIQLMSSLIKNENAKIQN